MKPIKLKFRGLQSYREEQEIDFDELASRGIFGVFGPTGAGKSTILDAITLALYGALARGQSRIRGIVNHFEDEVHVSFEFELGNHLYLAERAYKRRKKDRTVYNTISRLVRLDAEPGELLADTATEVSREIEKLLGMNFKDFTRAVIIPQNEFDKFLTLTDSERIEMLEKIFGLEEYGEKLIGKVKRLQAKLENEYVLKKNLLIELGDASEDRVKEAKSELDKKKKEVIDTKKQGEKLQNQLNAMKDAAKTFEEIKILEIKKEQLKGQEDEIKKIKEKLKIGRKISNLREPLRQIDEFKSLIIEARKKLDKEKLLELELKKNLNKARNDLEIVGDKEKELTKLREEGMSVIPLAKQNEENIIKLTSQKTKLEDIIIKTQDNLKLENEESEKRDEVFTREKKLLNDLKISRAKASKFLQCREEIDKANTLLKGLENEELIGKNMEKQLNDREKNLARIENSLRKLLGIHIKAPKDMGIEEIINRAEESLKKAVKGQELLRIDLEKEKDKNMAMVLASKLEEGQACQVCGSKHHPELAKDKDVLGVRAIEEKEENLIKYEKKLELIRAWLQEVHIMNADFNAKKQELDTNYKPAFKESREKIKQAKDELMDSVSILRDKISQIMSDYKIEARSQIAELKTQLDSRDKEYHVINQKIEEAEKKLTIINEAKDISDKKLRDLSRDLKGYKEDIKEIEEQINKLVEENKKLIGHLLVLDYETEIRKKIGLVEKEIKTIQDEWEKAREVQAKHEQALRELIVKIDTNKDNMEVLIKKTEKHMLDAGFENMEELKNKLLSEEEEKTIEGRVNKFEKEFYYLVENLAKLKEKMSQVVFDEEKYGEMLESYNLLLDKYDELVREEGALKGSLANLETKQKRWKELEEESQEILNEKDLVSQLMQLISGRKLAKFLAEEHLRDIAMEASIRLGELTNQRYSLELGDGFSFMMKDEYNNMESRWVNTLSGGETFLTSLALALALSSKIQLKGQALGFFFLDEGFGTLDKEKLELVMNTLERIRKDQRMVGIISHVEELKNRMHRYIEVLPAQRDGEGSQIELKVN